MVGGTATSPRRERPKMGCRKQILKVGKLPKLIVKDDVMPKYLYFGNSPSGHVIDKRSRPFHKVFTRCFVYDNLDSL